MSEHGGGDHGPVFVDIYGTSRRLGLEKSDKHGQGQHGFEGPHPEGPFWKRGLKGQLPLWIAFWGCFFFGHGIVIAFSVGTLLVGVVLGMSMDPDRTGESLTAARIMITLIGSVTFLFASWSVISVWRSAKHAAERKWGIMSRVVVSLYVVAWLVTISNVFG